MTYRETRFVAERVVKLLRDRDWLRHIKHDVTHLVAKRIENARAEYAESTATQRDTTISEGVALLKKTIREIIPPTFGWWLEMDHDIEICVRWIWLGHPAVVHSGCVSDFEPTILLALLRHVDWNAEATAAMANVEEAEATMLKAAQERRRLKLADTAHTLKALPAALPPVELPPPVPATLQEKRREKGPRRIPKRRETAEEMNARIAKAIEEAKAASRANAGLPPADEPWEDEITPDDEPEARSDEPGAEDEEPEDNRSQDEPTASETETAAGNVIELRRGFQATGNDPEPERPTYEERHAESPQETRYVHEEGLPDLEFGLSRQIVRTSLKSTRFESFPSLNAMLEAIRSNPPGTYTEAYVMGGMARMKTPEAVWNMIGRGPMPGRRARQPIRPMTAREFRRIDTGEPRARDNRFFRAG